MASWEAPPDLDPEILELCTALNAMPGITTYVSCCGHGDDPVGVWFVFFSPEELSQMLYYLSPCHGAPDGWRAIVSTDCGKGGPFYQIEGPAGDYEGSRKIAALILASLEVGQELDDGSHVW